MTVPMSILPILDQPVWLLFLQLLVLVGSVPELTFSRDLNNKVIFEDVDHPILLEGEERKLRDIISLHTGVPLDFSYNETGSNTPISAPGCPKSHDGRQWLYFGSPAKCYLVGFQGPCPWGKRFFSVDDSKYGICNCDCFAEPSSPSSPPTTTTPPGDVDIERNLILPRRNSRSSRMMSILSMGTGNRKFFYHPPSFYLSKDGRALRRSEKSGDEEEPMPNRYKFCHSPSFKRQVVYDGLRQQCFIFLDQDPCPNGEWLIKDLKGGIGCEKRKCPEFLGYNQPNSGGGFTYFDYKEQTCLTEVYGSLEESFFISANGILPNRQKFCQDAGMKYSQKLKTCVKDSSSVFDFKILG